MSASSCRKLLVVVCVCSFKVKRLLAESRRKRKCSHKTTCSSLLKRKLVLTSAVNLDDSYKENYINSTCMNNILCQSISVL